MIEIFDESVFEQVKTPNKLVVAMYPLDGGYINNWWIEFKDENKEEIDLDELYAWVDLLPDVIQQLDNFHSYLLNKRAKDNGWEDEFIMIDDIIEEDWEEDDSEEFDDD